MPKIRLIKILETRHRVQNGGLCLKCMQHILSRSPTFIQYEIRKRRICKKIDALLLNSVLLFHSALFVLQCDFVFKLVIYHSFWNINQTDINGKNERNYVQKYFTWKYMRIYIHFYLEIRTRICIDRAYIFKYKYIMSNWKGINFLSVSKKACFKMHITGVIDIMNDRALGYENHRDNRGWWLRFGVRQKLQDTFSAIENVCQSKEYYTCYGNIYVSETSKNLSIVS